MESSPFGLLPDELIMKIIKMTLEGVTDPEMKHVFLVDSIAKISTRFRRLSADKSLWRDQVQVPESDFQRLSLFPVTRLAMKGRIYWKPEREHWQYSYFMLKVPSNLSLTFPHLKELTLHMSKTETYHVSDGDWPHGIHIWCAGKRKKVGKSS